MEQSLQKKNKNAKQRKIKLKIQNYMSVEKLYKIGTKCEKLHKKREKIYEVI